MDLDYVFSTARERNHQKNKHKKNVFSYDTCACGQKKRKTSPKCITCYNKNKKPKKWSDDETNTLMQLKRQGVFDKIISKKLGRTINSILRQYQKTNKEIKRERNLSKKKRFDYQKVSS